jgi:hypothetical protein
MDIFLVVILQPGINRPFRIPQTNRTIQALSQQTRLTQETITRTRTAPLQFLSRAQCRFYLVPSSRVSTTHACQDHPTHVSFAFSARNPCSRTSVPRHHRGNHIPHNATHRASINRSFSWARIRASSSSLAFSALIASMAFSLPRFHHVKSLPAATHGGISRVEQSVTLCVRLASPFCHRPTGALKEWPR